MTLCRCFDIFDDFQNVPARVAQQDSGSGAALELSILPPLAFCLMGGACQFHLCPFAGGVVVGP